MSTIKLAAKKSILDDSCRNNGIHPPLEEWGDFEVCIVIHTYNLRKVGVTLKCAW